MHIIFESIKQNEAHANSTPPRRARSSLTGPILYTFIYIYTHHRSSSSHIHPCVRLQAVCTRTGCCVAVTSPPRQAGNSFTAIRTLSPTRRPRFSTLVVRGRKFSSGTRRFCRSYAIQLCFKSGMVSAGRQFNIITRGETPGYSEVFFGKCLQTTEIMSRIPGMVAKGREYPNPHPKIFKFLAEKLNSILLLRVAKN